jgi:hypothetical protein
LPDNRRSEDAKRDCAESFQSRRDRTPLAVSRACPRCRRIPPAAIRRTAGARGAEFAPAVGKRFVHGSGAPHRGWMRT